MTLEKAGLDDASRSAILEGVGIHKSYAELTTKVAISTANSEWVDTKDIQPLSIVEQSYPWAKTGLIVAESLKAPENPLSSASKDALDAALQQIDNLQDDQINLSGIGIEANRSALRSLLSEDRENSYNAQLRKTAAGLVKFYQGQNTEASDSTQVNAEEVWRQSSAFSVLIEEATRNLVENAISGKIVIPELFQEKFDTLITTTSDGTIVNEKAIKEQVSGIFYSILNYGETGAVSNIQGSMRNVARAMITQKQ